MPPIPDTTPAETCACGGKHWHVQLTWIAKDLWYCTLCGGLRLPGEDVWNIPADAARLLPNSLARARPAEVGDETPTRPGKGSGEHRR